MSAWMRPLLATLAVLVSLTATPPVRAQDTPGPATPVPASTAEAGPSPLDEAWFEAQVAAATAEPSVTERVSGELTQSMERVSLDVAADDLENFYLQVEFINPSDADEAAWDFGIQFRDQGDGSPYRLIVDSNGRWYLRLGIDTAVQSGTVTSLATGAGDANRLELVVTGDEAAFRLNGAELVRSLDLSERSGPGRLFVGTAFFTETTVEGAVTSYRDLQVWPLPATTPTTSATPIAAPTEAPIQEVPIQEVPTQEVPTQEVPRSRRCRPRRRRRARRRPHEGAEPVVDAAWFDAQVETATVEPSVSGPLAGELVQAMDSVSLAVAAEDEQNFYLRGRFQNPSDAAAPWDFGVQFRDAEGEFYRLIIDSEARWFLRQGTGTAVQDGTLDSGTLMTAADETNALELVVTGDIGAFRVNGQEVVGPLDLSVLPGPGRITVGAAFFTGNTVEGAVTNYLDVEVWRLPATPTSAGPIQTAVAALTTTPAAVTPEPTLPPAPTATPTPEISPTAPPLPSPNTSPTPVVDMAWFDAQVAAATGDASIVGPVSGELEHVLDRVPLYVAATDAENFYLRVRFHNPAAGDTDRWDFGVAFRTQAAGHYRVIIESDTRWYLTIGSDTLEQTGSVTTLDTTAGGSNLLEVVAVGNVGAFRLNGQELIGPLDLSVISGPGRISLGTAFSTATTIEGAVTEFQDLQVWPLSAAAQAGPTEAPVGPTATPAEGSVPVIPDAPTAEPTAPVALIPTTEATGSYESPRYGYGLTWDATWIEVVRFSDGTDDTLGLTNTTSLVGIIGSTKDGADALACRERAVRDNASNVGGLSAVLVNGQPLAGGDELRAWGVYRFTTGEGIRSAAYFECRALPTLGATVLVAMTTTEEGYNTQALLLATLLENLVLRD